MAIQLDSELRKEYEGLYSTCKIAAARRPAVLAVVDRMLAEQARYEVVAQGTEIPWFVVAAIHALESGCRFDRHLHNGDSLSARTVRWPAGRPPVGTPPFTWERSAADALKLSGLATWGDWSLAGALFKLEAYNGFGYRLHHPEIHTPYLWSFTNHYTKGKYAADRRFDPELVSQQAGAVALLLGLEEKLDRRLWSKPPPGAAHAPRASSPPRYPGRVVRRGDADRATVLVIQERLVLRNCGPLDADGIFGPDTEDAVKLFQARNVDRHGIPLEVDGRLGPLTWEALFGDETVTTVETHEQDEPLVAAALAVAETQIGVTEEPPFRNTGKSVGEYLKSVGLSEGNPWCAAFVHWCFQRAADQLGVPNPVFKTGHCMTHWREAAGLGVRRITAAEAIEDPALLAPGYVFIMHYGQDKGHTGIVVRVDGGLLETIEGNTNGAGSREGDGVYRKTLRRLRDINVGYIDYASLTPAVPKHEAEPGADPVVAPPEQIREIARLEPSKKCGGLLLQAVLQGDFEPPIWKDVPFGDLILSVGAHALRANVGGRLLRLPVSYCDVIAICNRLGWIPPTPEISDAIWEAATMRIPHFPMGDRSTPAASAIADKKMTTLEFVVGMNIRMDAKIPANRWGELAGTEGKDWVVSKRNLLPSRGAGPGSKGVANYGWHKLPNGDVVEGIRPDSCLPWHDDNHYDYSQTLRPIKRARGPAGEEGPEEVQRSRLMQT